MPDSAPEPKDLNLGPVTYLMSPSGGRYPDGNSILVEGERESVLIDPAIGLNTRERALPRVDRVLHSHCHEDHIAASHLFADVPWHFHSLDLPGITSLDAMMAIYGLGGEVEAGFRNMIVETFHYQSRPDPTAFEDGDRFDLGGVTIDVIHTPGHTRGHCCLMIRWKDAEGERSLLYLGDIELTSFGPYYGDAWSDLEAFEHSLAKVREIDARHYVTFHHVGALEGQRAFRERLDRFAAVIPQREARLLDFLRDPHTLEEIAEHRFVYRPGDPVSFIDCVERRSMAQHIERLLREGRVRETEPGRFTAASGRG